MRRTFSLALAAVGLCAIAGGPARADEPGPGSGFCDWVEGVAASESALLLSPELFASFGYLDQGVVADAPEATGDDLRLIAGVRYSLTGALEGLTVRRRARAQCRRYRAAAGVQSATQRRALAARARVLDAALRRAEEMLQAAERDVAGRRMTAQDAAATRIRVDELRALAAATRAEIAALGAAAGGAEDGAGALRAFHEADAEVMRQEGRLRRARAWDLSVRVGHDSFLGPADDDRSSLFAVVSVGVNLGALFQGGAEERAASGRRRFVQDEQPAGGEPALHHLRVLGREERRRAEETAVLVADLEQQLRDLERIGSETGRRTRQMLWFEWVKVKAEHEYLRAHVDGITALVGELDR
ncbi:MAG TPA: hypothetical protein VKZ63_05345 [Kofleriaceae bacterium]|nr:hypothetical protein [Kofleriaceae bacterium]